MVIYTMFITEMEMEKTNAFAILDTQREMQKDCLILKNVLEKK